MFTDAPDAPVRHVNVVGGKMKGQKMTDLPETGGYLNRRGLSLLTLMYRDLYAQSQQAGQARKLSVQCLMLMPPTHIPFLAFFPWRFPSDFTECDSRWLKNGAILEGGEKAWGETNLFFHCNLRSISAALDLVKPWNLIFLPKNFESSHFPTPVHTRTHLWAYVKLMFWQI